MKAKEKPVSIRWNLTVYLAVFIALVLLITGLFQVFLLDFFYEQSKRQELTESADILSNYLESNELRSYALKLASDYAQMIQIYKLENGTQKTLVNVDAVGDFSIGLSEERLEKYYRLAAANNNKYIKTIAFGGYEVSRDPLDNFGIGGDKNIPTGNRNLRILYVKLVNSETDGTLHMLVLTTALQPLSSTVQTLKAQFIWITAILLTSASIMVFFLYRKISKPLIRMNEAAKQLAKGEYHVQFSEENAYLEARELSNTLTYAAQELSRTDELQKELIANISHDLRTPLTMIRGYSELMRDLPGETTPENIQVIIDETNRLSALVTDLLDLSKIQAGVSTPTMEVFDLSAVIDDVMKRYDVLIGHKGYHISCKREESATVCADRGMILQVFYNLINNAINYTGADRCVTVMQNIQNNRVRISITDTGEGIPEDQLPLIWDRYYKVDKVHKQATIGTGLGLSIVKGILEAHHATYGVESTLGVGSTFWFELPIYQISTEE